MTTIAYKHKDKQIAVDSRVTCGGVIMSDEAVKYEYHDAALFFFAGEKGDIRKLVDVYNGGKAEGEVNCIAFVFVDGVVRRVNVGDDGLLQSSTVDYDSSIGRGDEVALTAMDYGASAKEAVEHAGKRTTSTGGITRVYDIKSARFIDEQA